MKAPALIIATLLLLLPAAQAAYPTPVVEHGLTLTLAMPPGEGDRFQHAEFSCWLPDPGRPVTAVIIHQQGCGNVDPDKHPPVTLDFHWRVLARKHNCALLVPQYQVAKPSGLKTAPLIPSPSSTPPGMNLRPVSLPA